MADPVTGAQATIGILSNFPGCHPFLIEAMPDFTVELVKTLVGMLMPEQFLSWVHAHYPDINLWELRQHLYTCVNHVA